MLAPTKDFLHAAAWRSVRERLSRRYLFAGLALLFLCFEILSGVLLLAYYRPTAAGAFYSMGILMDEVRLGWLVRAVHLWSAECLVLFTLLHLIQVYFSHAYAAPRQLTWATGVVLLFVLFAFSFTGTLLPWDQYAYWSTETARQTFARIPVVGTVVLDLLWGGWELGEAVLLRFYVLHIGVLPWILAAFLAAHFALVWRFRAAERAAMAQPETAARETSDFVINVWILTLLAGGLVLTLATVLPPPIADRADPLTPLPHVLPRWYFMPAHQLLRSLPGGIGASVIVAIIFAVFFIPVADAQPIQSNWRRILRWIVGALLLAGCVFLGVRGYR